MDRDALYLKHIMDEVHFLRSISKGLRKATLRKDPVRQRAIVRSLEVIGEAVKNLSDDLKRAHPDTDWRGIAGLRDKLVHHYFGVDWDVVWDVLKKELPELEGTIAVALRRMDGKT